MLKEPTVRNIVTDFYERIFSDLMIGFYFQGKDKERLIKFETELALEFLSKRPTYTGRPLSHVHAPLRIMGGHFDRRTEILKQVLQDHNVAANIIRTWIDHTEALRPQITGDIDGECAGSPLYPEEKFDVHFSVEPTRTIQVASTP